MVRLYCRCGHPIWVAAHWTGQDIVLLLYDGQMGRERGPITLCTHCGKLLVPADLERLAATSPQRPADARTQQQHAS
jgi:hypothetical protein